MTTKKELLQKIKELEKEIAEFKRYAHERCRKVEERLEEKIGHRSGARPGVMYFDNNYEPPATGIYKIIEGLENHLGVEPKEVEEIQYNPKSDAKEKKD